MRRVIVISPHFPPVNAPDHQRVRMSLPYLGEFGWSASILAIRPEYVEGAVIDPLLASTIPQEINVQRVRAVPVRATRRVGLGNLALRALPSLLRAGNGLLRSPAKGEPFLSGAATEKLFDLVFFSTTQFPVMSLGPIWKSRFGIPYVLDMQDPWLDDYYSTARTAPPGGHLRYRMSRFIARQLEPRVMRDVSQVICVSPEYAETLHRRYPYLRNDQFTVSPFGAAIKDFELLSALPVEHKLFDRSDGKQHWVYVGRGGPDMAAALSILFSELATFRRTQPDPWSNVRLHFAGTSYAPPDRAMKTVEPFARQCGVADLVSETTDRLPYFEALKALTEADALLVVGSDSPSYSASKLYPYMLARKPMLAVLHENSPAVKILRQCGAASVVTFAPAAPKRSAAEMARVLQKIQEMLRNRVTPELNESEFSKYSAREMTRKMCEVFDRAVESSKHYNLESCAT